MNLSEILASFALSQSISPEAIKVIQNNRALRQEMVDHFKHHKNLLFARYLLNHLIELRKNGDNIIDSEDLMLASYIVVLHGDVQDCLLIWQAKNINFDTFCGMDGQLIVVDGVEKTIRFLEQQISDEAKEALIYVNKYKASGELDDLEEYYANLWFI